jgi:hypothetical protein
MARRLNKKRKDLFLAFCLVVHRLQLRASYLAKGFTGAAVVVGDGIEAKRAC